MRTHACLLSARVCETPAAVAKCNGFTSEALCRLPPAASLATLIVRNPPRTLLQSEASVGSARGHARGPTVCSAGAGYAASADASSTPHFLRLSRWTCQLAGVWALQHAPTRHGLHHLLLPSPRCCCCPPNALCTRRKPRCMRSLSFTLQTTAPACSMQAVQNLSSPPGIWTCCSCLSHGCSHCWQEATCAHVTGRR